MVSADLVGQRSFVPRTAPQRSTTLERSNRLGLEDDAAPEARLDAASMGSFGVRVSATQDHLMEAWRQMWALTAFSEPYLLRPWDIKPNRRPLGDSRSIDYGALL
jgi:hypothetical protein